MTFSSGTGLHQRASLPARVAGSSNEGYVDDKTAESSFARETDDSKLELGIHTTDADDAQLIKKGSFKAHWSKLKRRLSLDTEHFEKHTFDDNEILPDELEYIEGGEIVHAEAPPSPGYQAASKHSLGPLKEEKESEKINLSESKSYDSEMSDRSRSSHSMKHGNTKSPNESLTPVSSETKL